MQTKKQIILTIVAMMVPVIVAVVAIGLFYDPNASTVDRRMLFGGTMFVGSVLGFLILQNARRRS